MTDRNGPVSQSMQRDTDKPAATCYALIVFVLMLIASCAVQAGQAYYSPISINSGQVPSTQTDFPVLVSVTNNRFKTIGNGGHVANSSGFDIRPYSDSGLTTAITGYELERYNASTGEVIMWVKVSSLSSSTTPIYLGYGDTSLTTDGSSTTTWSNSFLAVYHLGNGSTLNVNSSTGSNNGTNNNATATTGQIDGGGGFASASSAQILCGSSMNPTAATLSAWAKATTLPNAYNTTISRSGGVGPNKYTSLFVKSNGKLACFATGNSILSYDGTGTATLSTGTWYLLHMTYSSANGLIGYVNAVSDGTVAADGALNTTATTTIIGEDNLNGSRLWNGSMDEVRYSSVARSADWITTEYNNQSAPGTFETLGTEVPLSSPSNSNFFYFFP